MKTDLYSFGIDMTKPKIKSMILFLVQWNRLERFRATLSEQTGRNLSFNDAVAALMDFYQANGRDKVLVDTLVIREDNDKDVKEAK